MTRYEHCFLCNAKTGKAGRGEDSLYTDAGNGPFCPDCWEETFCQTCEGTGEIFVRRNQKGEVDYLDGSPTNEIAKCDMCKGEGFSP